MSRPPRRQGPEAVHIGAHVSTRGGILTAFDRAQELGAEAVQVHPTAPQTWRRLHLQDEEVQQFRSRLASTGLADFFFHAVYLINLGTPRPELLASSEASLAHYLQLANELGAAGVIFHPGSHLGRGFDHVLEQIGSTMRRALEAAPGKARLLVENSAGAGANLGATLPEIRRMLEAVDSPRVGLCLDTAHAFTSGWQLTTEEGLAAALAELEAEIGWDRLWAVHANDSKAPFGSNRDRHENIGEGEIGSEAFARMLADPRLRRPPWILEVPGEERQGPDRANVDRLRRLAGLSPLETL
ncbi:MAG: deoxyribonuclease IV [Candidatus Dormibacteraeota bacterium]|nr:deoxyribonuclease IV [Candidatus Dormibacteraeota bacterium]